MTRQAAHHLDAIPFMELDLAPSEDDNRRVMAVLAYLTPEPTVVVLGPT